MVIERVRVSLNSNFEVSLHNEYTILKAIIEDKQISRANLEDKIQKGFLKRHSTFESFYTKVLSKRKQVCYCSQVSEVMFIFMSSSQIICLIKVSIIYF